MSYHRPYNAVIDFKVISDMTTEPVTLEEIKQHLNLLFDSEESGEFDDDDTYLMGLAKRCRRRLEKFTGISFGEKVVRAILRNEKGSIELPYGPVRSVNEFLDEDGEEVITDDYALRGIEFKTLHCPSSCYNDITYAAGYDNPDNSGENLNLLPDDLKQALFEEIAFRYKNRGDQEGRELGVCASAEELAKPHQRIVWLQ